MRTVAELSAWMERFAPKRLAESWDNVGLLLGDPSSRLDRVMTCLTVTPESAGEAVEERAGLIVSHHPILFRPTQQVRADRDDSGVVWTLARAGVAVYSPHTAFDNTEGGINDGLAARLGLQGVKSLRPGPPSPRFKVVVFTPPADHDAVLASAFSAGAGRIGAYEECSFSTGGHGTFFGTGETSPTVGQKGRRERVREWKVEFVCPGDRLGAVLAGVRSAHSYEEPAIDVLPLHDGPSGPGSGRIGRLPDPRTLGDLATDAARVLNGSPPQVVGDPSRRVQKVAVACGAGDDFLKDADRLGADVLLTGEARFHKALEARSRGIGLILAGHHATERPGVEDLAARIAGAFPDLTVWASRRESDPIAGPMPSPAIPGG